MKRREFLAMAGLLGLGTSTSLKAQPATSVQDVIIVGAGAAGLTAGYRLRQRGIDFQILEAATTHGGRMKRNLSFADFPLPMGAEWLHTSPRVFNDILSDQSADIAVETIGYKNDDSFAFWDGETLTHSTLSGWSDRKFLNSSWFDFFDQYIVPPVADNIRFGNPVTAIDTSSDRAIVQTKSGERYAADAVIVTAPLKMLQERGISFAPPLPRSKIAAIDEAKFWDGYKAFLEFDEMFYPTYTEIKVIPETAGQHGFYNAAYGQNTDQNILGLFAVGSAATQYSGKSEAVVTRQLLRQLDEVFAGQATRHFRKIITQDWSQEPFIGGAYVHDHEDWRRVRELGKSVGAHLHFAGEAYTDGEDWGSVHNAALAAKRIADQL